MAWDIYGEPLRRGFCEVHPWVQQGYPCQLCYMEDDKRRQQKIDQSAAKKAEAEAYYDELYAEHQMELLQGGSGIA
jgi:hypothetical protein